MNDFYSNLFVKGELTKDDVYKNIYLNMCIKTRDLFKYNGLPQEFPPEYYEAYLQRFGSCIVTRHNDEIITTFGGFGGEPNGYYIPTKYIVANPYFKIEKTYTNDVDCIVHKNNSLFMSTYSINNRYARLLTEVEMSMQTGVINSRIPVVFNASDTDTKESVERFYDDIKNGKNSVIMSDFLFDTLKSIPFGQVNNNYFTQYIEIYQYIESKWWAEYGIDSVNNMKRESLSSYEISANIQTTKPLICDMLENRQKSWMRTNEMYGTSVTVELNPLIYETINNTETVDNG